MKCPLCGGSTDRCFSHRGYGIRACDICGHRTTEIVPTADHVATIYNDGYFADGGAGYRDYTSEAGMLIERGRQYGQLMKNYTKAGMVLDVGAAAGFVLKGYIDSGWVGEGIEPNQKMAEYARTRLGVPMTTVSLEAFRSDGAFDLISMIQVIAHFVDPRAALKVADSVTRPRGFWLIETWNRESLTARLFGKHWHEYSPPSVLHWFSPQGISRLGAEFGYREVGRGKPSKRITVNHARSLLLYTFHNSHLGRAANSLLRFLPPNLTLPYPAEDLFWILLQKT